MGLEIGPPPGVVIGDVHGCIRELDALLDLLGPELAGAGVWFTGDLVNRGPASAEVLRRARELGAATVLGNHDLHLLALAAGLRPAHPRDTLEPLLAAGDVTELLDWLRCQPLVREWEPLTLVHAGLHPAWTEPGVATRGLAPAMAGLSVGEIPADDPAVRLATRVRYCTAEGELTGALTEPPPGYRPWNEYQPAGRRVACGHWAARGIVTNGGLRALDGGCVYGGALAAWIVAEDRIVTVPAHREYCPRRG